MHVKIVLCKFNGWAPQKANLTDAPKKINSTNGPNQIKFSPRNNIYFILKYRFSKCHECYMWELRGFLN